MALKFGIELECMGLTGNEIREALEEVGEGFGGLFGYRGGTHCVDEGVWRAESDSSLTGSFCGWDRAGSHEIISPVMNGEEGKKTVKRVMKALKRKGATVDRSCGTHLHVGFGHLARWARMSQAKKIEIGTRMQEIYSHFQPVFDALSPNNRFASRNTYVGTCSWDTRYSAVNMMAFINYGRVEFRQPGFTLNPMVIEMWMGLIDSVVKAAMNENHASYHADVQTFEKTLPAMLDFLNCGSKVSTLAVKRINFCISQYQMNRSFRIEVADALLSEANLALRGDF